MQTRNLLRLAILTLALGPAASFSNADIFGGTPSASDDDFFTRNNGFNSWGVRVRSFAYGFGSSIIPVGVPANGIPGPGETLFLYLVENVGTSGNPQQPAPSDTAVVTLTVANPSEPPSAPILSVGKATLVNVLNPIDLSVTGIREDPRQFNINPLNIDYNWITQALPPPPTDVLHPNEYSIVYFKAAATWTNRDGLVTGAGLTDSETILGPIVPEPATIALLALGAFLIRRRG